MSTITYKNQPAVHSTRGAVPSEGLKAPYTISKLLWPEQVSAWIEARIIHPCLHICCGLSQLGDIRLDLYQPNVDIQADMARLPFTDHSFATVLIDPPYTGRFQQMHDMLSELARVSNYRIIHQNWYMPVDRWGRYKKDHRFWLVEAGCWQPQTYFGRAHILSVFDVKQG